MTVVTGSWSTGRSGRYAYYHCRKCKGLTVQREKLESLFVRLLERLQPKAPYMHLFRAVVQDVWRSRQLSTVKLRATFEQRIGDLQRRLDRLDEAFIQERSVDRTTYERQRDKLREQLLVAQMEHQDASVEELDVEGVLGFAETVLCDAARLWTGASLEQKQRLQGALFPEGVTFDGETLGTALTCLAFNALQEMPDLKVGMASPGTPSWNQILKWLRDMQSLRESAGNAA